MLLVWEDELLKEPLLFPYSLAYPSPGTAVQHIDVFLGLSVPRSRYPLVFLPLLLCQGHAPWPTSSLLDKALQHNSYHIFLFCVCTITNTFASPSDGCISFGRFFRWGVKGPGSSLSTNISTEFIFIQHCFFPSVVVVEWAGSMATKALLALHVNNWMRRIAHSCFGDL